jgi:hypothetical protein
MSLVSVFSPETEAELVTVVALLEAHDIACFVRNAGIGSLIPGPQVNGYNTRDVMVDEKNVADALELLEDFQPKTSHAEPMRYPVKSRLRSLLETILFGWFVPGSRSRDTRDRG